MTKKNKNVTITTPSVTVNSGNPVNGASNGSTRTRNRRNRKNKGGSVVLPATITNTAGQILAELQDMNSGRMTSDPSSDLSFIRSIREEKCCMDENAEGWYFKYLDPAGSVETARAIGEFSKIPDGLLTFSVDAEIRLVDHLSVPVPPVPVPDPAPPVGTIDLSGRTWSLTIFSYPMFRTAYIAVANIFDKEISEAVAAELAFTLNNLTNYRETIDMDDWSPFAAGIEDGWYFWIKPLPPTYNLPDPVAGNVRTLTSWRMSYKAITLEHNAPTLLDQGFWNGGHYALDPTRVEQVGQQSEMVPSFIHARATTYFNSGGGSRFNMIIPNLPQIASVTGPGSVNSSSVSFDISIIGDSAGVPVSFVVPANTAWYNPFEVVFAEPGDTVSVSASGGFGQTVTLTSSSVGATPIVLTFPSPGNFVAAGAEALEAIFVDTAFDLFINRSSNQIEFPAYTPAQVAANNPKMEQFLMKETNGAYVVHKKMRKPVFEVTPAGSFGPVQFTTPGYNIIRNSNDGSGILDTIDANFSTASICVRGIAHANVPILKVYQGWEGVTNVNTPFGQFGHTGSPRNDSVMQLVDNLTVRTTGIYPANDNFLGLIAKFAAGALKSLLSSQATPVLLGNLAQGVINKGLGAANDKLSQAGQRTIRRSATRFRLA